jgi:hypothetical protein
MYDSERKWSTVVVSSNGVMNVCFEIRPCCIMVGGWNFEEATILMLEIARTFVHRGRRYCRILRRVV